MYPLQPIGVYGSAIRLPSESSSTTVVRLQAVERAPHCLLALSNRHVVLGIGQPDPAVVVDQERALLGWKEVRRPLA